MDADFSSFFASYGTALKAAWTAAFHTINVAGGINGHKVKVIYLDDASVPTTTVSNAKQLVGSGALLVRSDPDSNSCAEIQPTTARAHIPLMCEAAYSNALSIPYGYTINLPESFYIPGVYSLITKKVGPAPKIAELVIDVAGELAWASAMSKEVGLKGGTISTDQLVPVTNLNDITSQTSAILASHPDAVLSEGPPSMTVSFVEALRAGGFTGPIYSLSPDYSSMITLKDSNFYETYASEPVAPGSRLSGAATYVKSMAAVGLTGATTINAATIGEDYLSALLVAKALNSCGNSCTSRSLNKDLAQTVVQDPGLTLPTGFGYTPTRHQPLKEWALYGYSASSKSQVVLTNLLAPALP